MLLFKMMSIHSYRKKVLICFVLIAEQDWKKMEISVLSAVALSARKRSFSRLRKKIPTKILTVFPTVPGKYAAQPYT